MLTEIFCFCDDFCHGLFQFLQNNFVPDSEVVNFQPSPRMRTSEIMTILIAFHLSGYHDFKHFYLHVQNHHRGAFSGLLSYSRFIELVPYALLCLLILSIAMRAPHTGKSFVDSTALAVCKNKRIFSHKVFKGLAKRGKNTMGWFFGFKLHLVTNDRGQLLTFRLTPGNTDDRDPVESMTKSLFGKLFADKGYISQKLLERLLKHGLKIVTAARSNMKPRLMELEDSQNLNQRSLIESVVNVLKNSCRIEHSRHRSVLNFCVNTVAALCAYIFKTMLFKHTPSNFFLEC